MLVCVCVCVEALRHRVLTIRAHPHANIHAQDLDLFDWSLADKEMASADAATSPKGTPSFMCTS